MLRRVNATVFAAPAGARIQVITESQNNNAVHEARFEYGNRVLDAERILDRPGCSITVADDSELLDVTVIFDPSAPAGAQYDLFEVENGVKSALGKFTKKSDGPTINFAIDPTLVPVGASRDLAFPSAAAPKAARAAKPKPKKAARRAKKEAAAPRRRVKRSKAKTAKAKARRRTSTTRAGSSKKTSKKTSKKGASSKKRGASRTRARSSSKRTGSRKR
jgi:hypothetical protein